MTRKRLVLLVEGQGDREAAPVLLKRLLPPNAFDSVILDSDPPLRVGEFRKLSRNDYQDWRRYLRAAVTTRKNVGGCLLILDGDDPG